MRLTMALIGGFATALWLAPDAAADTVDIREWKVPWEKSRPRDPYVEPSGRVWFVGQRDHYVAHLDPASGEITRFDLDDGTGPHNVIVAGNGADAKVWYAGNLKSHVGCLDPQTGNIRKFPMPDEAARDPHTLVFDAQGNVWFTVQIGNFVGKLESATGNVSLLAVPTPRARPYGIKLDAVGKPWVVAFGTNKLLAIDAEAMTLEEIEIPDPRARPRRLEITPDGRVWYVDYALGQLGSYDPATRDFTAWDLPSGGSSQPYGMAQDRANRLWIVETGVQPNRFVGFDPATESFFSATDIPSGGGRVRHMYFHEPAGEVWFGTDTNYIGRAKVH